MVKIVHERVIGPANQRVPRGYYVRNIPTSSPSTETIIRKSSSDSTSKSSTTTTNAPQKRKEITDAKPPQQPSKKPTVNIKSIPNAPPTKEVAKNHVKLTLEKYPSDVSGLHCIPARSLLIDDIASYCALEPDNVTKLAPGDAFTCVDLQYPSLNTESFPLVSPSKKDDYSPVKDLNHSIEHIVNHCVPESSKHLFGTQKVGIQRQVIKFANRRQAADLVNAVNDFNNLLKEVVTSEEYAEWNRKQFKIGKMNDFDFVAHVLEQSYARAVAPHSDLLTVKGFGSTVYGEVKTKLVNEFIQKVSLSPGQVFLDMGSGIGNVVLQVAASCLCESWGIEILESASTLAEKQRVEFVNRMRYYGKPCGKITLKCANFLHDSETHDVIRRADVIFVNNYIFDARLNMDILALFLDLKESAKVITLRRFGDRKINARTQNSIGNILKTEEFFFGKDSVSWMADGGQYYIHTVDREDLKKLAKNNTLAHN